MEKFWKELQELCQKHNKCFDVYGYEWDAELVDYSEQEFNRFKDNFQDYTHVEIKVTEGGTIDINDVLTLAPHCTPFLEYLKQIQTKLPIDPHFKVFTGIEKDEIH